MAERLTEKDKYGNNAIFQNKDKFTIAKDKNNDIRVYGKAIDKLAQLEDVMEEHDFNTIEDLQDFLNFAEKVLKEYKQVKTDRDNWQKACELACKHIAEVEWLSCPETDDISESENEIATLTKQALNHFYQQAKTEGNNE